MILKRTLFFLFAFLAIAVGLYPGIYFFMERDFGLLASKTPELLSDTLWNGMFYTHIIFGGLALLVGWVQFSKKVRQRHLQFHKNIGKLYVITVLLSAISGIYIGYFATGGWITKTGFMTLGVIWFFTTLKGYTAIRNKNIEVHQKMMIYSYAACFAAVTLRIWLPILTAVYGEFLPAYRIVAWLCWVPNLLIAYFIIKKTFKPQQLNLTS